MPMTIKKPVVDYLQFRPNKLNTDTFRHLKLLLYWPVFGIFFMYVERIRQVSYYYPMHCSLDDIFPFCELFVIPYLFWFVYLVGMHLYTLLYDIAAFRKMMKFIIITYSAAMLIYLVFPNCQELLPIDFARDNFLTRFMSGFYQFDTNTNVCPSIHVIGSLAVWFASWEVKAFRTPGWCIGFGVAAILICVSTVFLKQHSILDLFAAIPICLIAYVICFGKKKEKPRKKAAVTA